MRVSIKDKIKPLWILFSNKWGGSEQVLMGDIANLSESGIACSLLCIEGSAVHAYAIRHKNIQIFTLASGPKGVFDLRFFHSFKTLVRKIEPNIILLNDHFLLYFLEPLLFQKNRPSIISIRHLANEPSYFLFLKRYFYRRLEYMIVLSESVKRMILAQGILSEKKVKVINLGLDFTRFDPATISGKALREKWKTDSETIVIGTIGKMTPEMGQDTFLKAAAGLSKYPEFKVKFVVIDEDPLVSDPEYVEHLKKLISSFHLEDKVILEPIGEENLTKVMAAFDVFVMLGNDEVPGLGALEALAMEKAVVLSKIDGAVDIVGKEEFGLIVRPHDAFDLQYKILNLLENPEKRKRMGALGRDYVLRHFDKKTRLIRSIDIYERCLKRQMAKKSRKKN